MLEVVESSVAEIFEMPNLGYAKGVNRHRRRFVYDDHRRTLLLAEIVDDHSYKWIKIGKLGEDGHIECLP